MSSNEYQKKLDTILQETQRNPAEHKPSLMNIPFLTKETDADKAKVINDKFVKEAAEAGLVNLAGHRLVGGMRASIYNAMVYIA